MRTHRYTTPAVTGPFPANQFLGVRVTLPCIPSGLSRKRYRKRQRQRRRAAKVEALVLLDRFERNYPEVLDVLDTTPLNLQGISPL